MDIDQAFRRAADALKHADALMLNAGAGIGVDSGLPDFRGNEGFWKAYPPIAKLGISFIEMANPHWFDVNPKLAWAFYGHRLLLYRKTSPHQGFNLLLDYGKMLNMGYFVFTSNVDGQFQKAGYNEEFIVECHGSIHHFQCASNCTSQIWDAYDVELSIDEDKFEAHAPLPNCIQCDKLARPNILMFGDWGWIPVRSNNQEIRLNNWLLQLEKENKKLVIVELGAGKAIPTVRMKSEEICRRLNATLIRINPRDHNVPSGQIAIPTGSEKGVKEIMTRL